MAKVGRPIKWTIKRKREAVATILEEIASGKSLRSILDNADRSMFPSLRLFNEWLSDDLELSKQYARACEDRADLIFEEIIDISDEANADLSISEKGFLVINGEAVQRSRLRVDARKWVLSKMNPKKYGDRTELDHKSSDGSMSPKIDYSKLTLEEKLALREIHMKLNPKDERA